MIDVNVNLSRWPFRRLPCDETAALVVKLPKNGVKQGWAGSFDGVFHKDISGANARLAAECRKSSGLLLPFGSVNPRLPDWPEDVRRCQEVHGMKGIRLNPNYHGYRLDDAVFAEVLKLAAERKLVVQLSLCMEDERTQHPLMRVPPVDITPLPRAVSAQPDVRLVVVNCYPQLPVERLRPLSASGQVYFDMSMTERVDGVARLVEQVSPERVLFGSYFPFFDFEAAALKLQESSLPLMHKTAIMLGNAQRLLAK